MHIGGRSTISAVAVAATAAPAGMPAASAAAAAVALNNVPLTIRKSPYFLNCSVAEAVEKLNCYQVSSDPTESAFIIRPSSEKPKFNFVVSLFHAPECKSYVFRLERVTNELYQVDRDGQVSDVNGKIHAQTVADFIPWLLNRGFQKSPTFGLASIPAVSSAAAPAPAASGTPAATSAAAAAGASPAPARLGM